MQYDSIQKKEADALIRDIRRSIPNITRSADVSHYIVEHRVQRKYSHIAGHLEMADQSSSWTYKGGISPKWYAYVCENLGVHKKGARVQAGKFTSYAQMQLCW